MLDSTPINPATPADTPEGLDGGSTDDALVGSWRILQPRKGHRWSTDDLLCAWFARDTMTRLQRTPDRALDLGCGLASVALMLAWCWPELMVTGLEKQPHRLDLARRSVARNGCGPRVHLWLGDVAEAPMVFWDQPRWPLVTATPPYWPPATGTHTTDDKARCRFDLLGDVETYARVVPALLAPDGIFVMVYDGRQRERLARATLGLVPLRKRAVIAREGDPPLLVLGAWGLIGPGDLQEEPPLLLRHRDGRRSDAFRALRTEMGMPA